MAIAAEVLADNRDRKSVAKLAKEIEADRSSVESLKQDYDDLSERRKTIDHQIEYRRKKINNFEEAIEEALEKEALGQNLSVEQTSRRKRYHMEQEHQEIDDLKERAFNMDKQLNIKMYGEFLTNNQGKMTPMRALIRKNSAKDNPKCLIGRQEQIRLMELKLRQKLYQVKMKELVSNPKALSLLQQIANLKKLSASFEKSPLVRDLMSGLPEPDFKIDLKVLQEDFG